MPSTTAVERDAAVFRYVALAWNPSHPQQAETARRISTQLHLHPAVMRLAWRAAGIMVLCADTRPGSSEPRFLAHDAGVVLGKIFHREAEEPSARVDFDARESTAILVSAGRRLVERYWGRYVAFLRDETDRTTWVLRDPSGGLPCFVTRHEGVDLFFSSIEDCLGLGALHFTINWRYVEAVAAYPGLQIRDTGLEQVSEVQPGECIEIAAGGSAIAGGGSAIHADASLARTMYWDPVRIAREEPLESVEDAVAALVRTTRACVSAWASCYQRILLTLSGGLDSSIVLGSLRHASKRPDVTCINYFDASAEGDERAYARLAANEAGCELIECERDVSAVRLDKVFDIAKSPRPWFYFYYLTHSPTETRWAHQKRAAALFSGGGGDQLFYTGDPRLGAADFVHRHGLSAELWSIALDAAHARHVSIWSVLRGALRDGLFRRHHSALVDAGTCRVLLNAEVIARTRRNALLTHPWLGDTTGMAPGKLRQLLSMSLAPAFYNPLGRADDPESVHPLFSQPMVELSLRIPTWILGLDGRNRGLARRAFAGDVPAKIIARRDKGGMTPFAVELLRRNQAFVREVVLDGRLAHAGIIDRRAVERLLSKPYSARTAGVAELDDYLSLEAWLRSWTQVRQGAIAAA